MSSDESFALRAHPEARFSCQSCGDCCRAFTVPISDEDVARIEALDWRELVPEESLGFWSMGAHDQGHGKVLSKSDNGACVFLDDEADSCRLHARFGGASKPLACRAYPYEFAVLETRGGTLGYAGLSFACKGVACGDGEPLKNQLRALDQLRRELLDVGALAAPETMLGFGAGPSYEPGSMNWLLELLCVELADPGRPLSKRLLVVTHFVDLVAKSRFPDLSDPSRTRMIEALLKGSRNHVDNGLVSASRSPSSLPERLLFRQLGAFRTLEHRDGERRRSLLGRVAGLLHGVNWMLGIGRVALGGDARAARVSRVREQAPRAELDAPVAQSALTRYLVGVVASRRLLGKGLGRRGLLVGLGLLFRQIPMVLLLARAACLERGGSALSSGDYTRALRVADLSFGRFPRQLGPLAGLHLRFLGDLDGFWSHLDWCAARGR